jgi:hypothetical protein
MRFAGDEVAATLGRVIRGGGKPRVIRVDNGRLFTSKSLDQWAYAHGVELDFIRPGTPTDNATIEFVMGSCERNACIRTGSCRRLTLRRNWATGLQSPSTA